MSAVSHQTLYPGMSFLLGHCALMSSDVAFEWLNHIGLCESPKSQSSRCCPLLTPVTDESRQHPCHWEGTKFHRGFDCVCQGLWLGFSVKGSKPRTTHRRLSSPVFPSCVVGCEALGHYGLIASRSIGIPRLLGLCRLKFQVPNERLRCFEGVLSSNVHPTR